MNTIRSTVTDTLPTDLGQYRDLVEQVITALEEREENFKAAAAEVIQQAAEAADIPGQGVEQVLVAAALIAEPEVEDPDDLTGSFEDGDDDPNPSLADVLAAIEAQGQRIDALFSAAAERGITVRV